ncbi:hypothetical protein QAD02_016210 [Eretmocerus hayati]|uniref:Uncharacterized protein n=1 Tax=Eretmocerus hayati TaxID=131215 RepID=A0ACC2PAF2_9HYME|nr:hypothetical protein QAD02_016210 [Eretmocerus hayati]
MALRIHDIQLPDNVPELLLEKHADYIISCAEKSDDDFQAIMTEHMRMSAIYWGLTALDLMDQLHRADKEKILKLIKDCQYECGGIGAFHGHDPHVLHTLSAIQILCLFDALDTIDIEKVICYLKERQEPDGSFTGDKWGEVDTRFSFCTVASLALLGRLDVIDVEGAVRFICKCMNFDGGFGPRPDSESHAGMIYCCVGTLSILGQLHHLDVGKLGWWLCERQLPSGGLNGRPEKLPDVCYSWWVLSSMKILNLIHWIDKERLIKFILACQDTDTGGFSDRPGDMADPFHTLFGLGAMSMLGASDSLKEINPTFCMPEYVIQRLGLEPERLDR